MSLQDVKEDISDFLNEIIPAIIKVIVALSTLDFLSSGKIHETFGNAILNSFAIQNSEQFKLLIENYYLKSVMPLLYIILSLVLVLLLNRAINFIGSLVPLRVSIYTLSFQKANFRAYSFLHTYMKEMSQTDIFNLNEFVKKELEINKDSTFDKIKKELDDRSSRLYDILYFLYFNLICACFFYIFYGNLVDSYRFVLIMVILLLLVIAYISKIALNFANKMLLDARQSLYYLVKYKGAVETVTFEQREEALEIYKDTPNKWWTVKFGYDLGWIRILKYFTFTFYRNYVLKKWKKQKDEEFENSFRQSSLKEK
jgi:hypothetical protein